MDETILKALIAPAMLTWKKELGKELMSRRGTEDDSASVAGAVAIVLTASGALEGRVLYLLDAMTAKGAVGTLRSRYKDVIDEASLEAIRELAGRIADLAEALLHKLGYDCAITVSGVLDLKGKGIANADRWPYATRLTSLPDYDNPGDTDEIGVWIDVRAPGAETVDTPGSESAAEEDERESEPSDAATDDPAPGGESAGDSPREPGQDDSARSPSAADDAILARIDSELSDGDEPDEGEAKAPPADDNRRSDFASGEDSETATCGPDAAPATAPVATIDSYDELVTELARVEKMEVPDAADRVRVAIGTLLDGSPYVVLADDGGRIRLSVSLAPDGSPHAMCLDEFGRRLWEAPGPGAVPAASVPPKPSRVGRVSTAPGRRSPATRRAAPGRPVAPRKGLAPAQTRRPRRRQHARGATAAPARRVSREAPGRNGRAPPRRRRGS